VTLTTNGQDPTTLTPVSNDAEQIYELERPWAAELTITGTAPLLFHRYSVEEVAAKSNAKKGSAAKKTDNLEASVYRDDAGFICAQGVALIAAITDPSKGSAKSVQDPRSPHKSACDLYRSALIASTVLAPITNHAGELATTWDAIDQRRAIVQRAAVSRSRPMMHSGWSATFIVQCLAPEYITPADLRLVVTNAGRFVGIGDFRPTYGRFDLTSFKVLLN